MKIKRFLLPFLAVIFCAALSLCALAADITNDAKITFEKHRLYRNGKGPVLYANTVKACDAPEKEIAEF